MHMSGIGMKWKDHVEVYMKYSKQQLNFWFIWHVLQQSAVQTKWPTFAN